jgi:hypothetical protein
MPSQADISLFYYHKGSVIIFLLVYVDDIIVASSSLVAVTALLHDLQGDFTLKDLGCVHYFLVLRFNVLRTVYVLRQSIYTHDLLQRAGMLSCKPALTPLSSSSKLSVHEGGFLATEDATNCTGVLWVPYSILR